MGAQVWGTGPELYLTIDRGDVWDLRYEENHGQSFSYSRLRELVKQRRRDLIQKEMTPDVGPLKDLTPTRISIGRIRIALPKNTTVRWSELDMESAEVHWLLDVEGEKVHFRVFAPPDHDAIVVLLDGLHGKIPRATLEALGDINQNLVKKLGYETPSRHVEGDYSWVLQKIPGSGEVVSMWTTFARDNGWGLILTIPPQSDSGGVAAARGTLERLRSEGPEKLRLSHQQWWRSRWARSSVEIPDPALKRLWINGLYKLASSSYKGAPTNLQGLWPPDGEIPPGRGDYHCDMNVQETYWPAYSSNQLDLVEPLNRWLLNSVVPENEKLTRRFFGVEGLWFGTALDMKGRLIGGENNWMTVQYWLGAGAWMAQHVWWYWSYSQDKAWLERHGYPLLKKSLAFFEHILEAGPDGRLHIPLSTSPEFYSNDLESWSPDPTCDLSLVRNLIRYTSAAAGVLGVDLAKRGEWMKMDARLAPYPVGKGGLKVQPDTDYFRSHRHPMHLFPIFPGEDLTVEGSLSDRKLIEESIRMWVHKGTGEWTGWSYPYGSMIASRARRGNHALQLLETYQAAYIWPNGFHVNGDYKKRGFSFFEYEPFTVEAECAFTAAVNEMLLQSWGGRLRIFPALPDEWTDVAFRDLRAEGGLLVSAEMRRGEIVSATIRSEQGGEAKVVFPLGYVAPGTPSTERVFRLKAGEQIDLALR